MNSTLAAVTIVISFLVQAECCASEPPAQRFSYRSSDSNRFLAIHRTSNIDVGIAGYVTVFEYLGDGKPLRKLYEMKLASTGYSFMTTISPDGRFFITMDETSAIGTGPHSLIIYDLARKEFTAYSCKAFLSEDIYNSLESHPIFSGLWWHGSQNMFNRDSTKFYPTEYEYFKRQGKEEKIPFVEVDLLSRSATVVGEPKIDSAEISLKVKSKGIWVPSEEVVATENTVLPKSFTRISDDGPDLKYELDAKKTDYIPIKGP